MKSVEDFIHLEMLREREAISGPISENNSRVVVRENLTPLEQVYRDYWRANVSPNDVGCWRPDPSRPELSMWTGPCCDWFRYEWDSRPRKGLPNEIVAQDVFVASEERVSLIPHGECSFVVEAKDFTDVERKFAEAGLEPNDHADAVWRYEDGDKDKRAVLFKPHKGTLTYYRKPQ